MINLLMFSKNTHLRGHESDVKNIIWEKLYLKDSLVSNFLQKTSFLKIEIHFLFLLFDYCDFFSHY